MQFLKIFIGISAILLAWAFVYRTKLIFNLNAWMREYVFSDKLVLFSNRRMAALLLILGAVALFSGVEGVVDVQPIKPNIAAKMIEQARMDFRNRAYAQVITRCKELVRSYPKNEEAWELLANAWWAIGRRPLAMQAMESLIRLNPDYPWADTPLGRLIKENKPKKK